MKVAVVTTSPDVPSGIGDYTRHLLPYLARRCDVRVVLEPGARRTEVAGLPARSIDELDPREHDRILWQIGNERGHAFMARALRALGGVAAQHDWVLFDLAVAAFPALARGGWKGHALALREGGPDQARAYLRNWLERRAQRRTPYRPRGGEALPGTLLCGWHEPQPDGRWTADVAELRVPADGVLEVEVAAHADAGRAVRLVQARTVLAELEDGRLRARPGRSDRPVLALETAGISVTREQRRHGDGRRLGCFVEGVRWRDAEGWHELDLSVPAELPIVPVTLARDRFALPLNRSVVRFADAFVVHSRYVAERIVAERNERTPIGIVHHGAERRWRGGDRRALRRALGLPEAWTDGFLVVSFGGVQAHKRIGRVLEALRLARERRGDVRLVLAGKRHADGFDAEAEARRLGLLPDAVRLTGFVPEEQGWDWLHAGDVAVNLRGPTTGGTSGGIFQAFSLGRAVIVSDAGEQRELPDACTVKVPLGDGEVEALARALVDLRDRPERRDALEAAARRFVEDECHWDVVAAGYAAHLERFPAPRANRRSLVALAIERGRRRAAARAAG